MKKKILSLFMAGIMCTALAGCGGDSAGSTTAPDEGSSAAAGDDTADSGAAPVAAGGDMSINVILKTTASEYWGYVVAGCEAYGADNPNVQVDVQGASSETAYDEQLNIIETNLASGQYNGYVIAPLQADMVVKQISGTEYPVIAVDTAIEAPEVLSFVGTGNEEAALEGGKSAVQMAKDAGWTDLKAISISGVQGDTTVTARLTGYQKGVEEAGGEYLINEVQYADAVADKAYASMEAIMQNHPEGIAMVLCNNDDMAIAAARAAAGNEAYADTIFVGFDGIQSACNAILAGEETMSIAQNAYQMGYKAVEACVEAASGNPIEEFIDSGSSVITSENAQEQLELLQSYLE